MRYTRKRRNGLWKRPVEIRGDEDTRPFTHIRDGNGTKACKKSKQVPAKKT